MTAYIYSLLTLVVILFQLALAAGAPWGSLAMGGKFPGRFPPAMRFGAVVQAAILALLVLIVLARAGVILPQWHDASKWAIWAVVGISAVSTVLNLITPSKWERILWAPTGIVLTLCSLSVALG